MKKFSKRFEDLQQEAKEILKTNRTVAFMNIVDETKFQKWTLRVKNLIFTITGENSFYLKDFDKIESVKYAGGDNLTKFKQLIGVLDAVKEDYENGHLISFKNLIEADVFEIELEQAKELLNKKYKTASAVIAGIVLETSLRSLCDNYSIPHGKLDKMNADLAKLGIYNKLQQKKVTTLADIRNSAAHGKEQEFSHDDVNNMIKDVESFITLYLTS